MVVAKLIILFGGARKGFGDGGEVRFGKRGLGHNTFS
jgi:hypothetical protein